MVPIRCRPFSFDVTCLALAVMPSVVRPSECRFDELPMRRAWLVDLMGWYRSCKAERR